MKPAIVLLAEINVLLVDYDLVLSVAPG